MHRRLKLVIAVAAFLCSGAAAAVNDSAVDGRSATIATRDAVATVEANRPKVIARMVDQYRAAMESHGISDDAFRAALWELAPDRLLAASLADSIEEVNTIVAQSLAGPTRAEAKDGPGTGANSWIGYTAGNNQASGTGSAVAAGTSNVASGPSSFVGAGTFNAATAQGAFVGGGTSNVANAISALVMGGFDNRATVIDSAVVAGAGNRATGARSVVVGGGYNLASGQWSFIGGGGRQMTSSGGAGTSFEDNVAAGDFSTIGGGRGNRAGTDAYATVAGGEVNIASGVGSTVAGGGGNIASGAWGAVAGGFNNTASALNSAVGAGFINVASGDYSTVAGGSQNTASQGYSTVAGGSQNTASQGYSTVAGGFANTASGVLSFAAGHNAVADQSYCTLFGLWSTGTAFNCIGVGNIFRIGADHGFSIEYFSQRPDGGGNRWMYVGDVFGGKTINTWTGAYLSDAGVWVNASSSKASKTDFADVDTQDVLRHVMRLPITTWRYKEGEGQVRHIGPMAEDFWAAFQVGYGDHTIADLDARGVAFAAVQGLNQKLDRELEENHATIAAQAKRIAALEEQAANAERLQTRVSSLEVSQDELRIVKAALAELLRERATMTLTGRETAK